MVGRGILRRNMGGHWEIMAWKIINLGGVGITRLPNTGLPGRETDKARRLEQGERVPIRNPGGVQIKE